MQNAKDTFYQVLRERLMSVNPERTVDVRGIPRPALLVDENELLPIPALPECFHLRWGAETVEANGALASVTLVCEIAYATAGTAANGGMDRGRALAAMDGELLNMAGQAPQNAVKNDYSALASGGAAMAMPTRIWWGDVAFGALKVERDRMARTATVAVHSYQEVGEL